MAVLALVGLATLNVIVVSQHWVIIKPVLKQYMRNLMEIQPDYRRALSGIANHINQQAFASESAKLDYVRGWVHRNSLHLMDGEHDEYAWKNHLVIRKLWEAQQGLGSRPHLSCGPRAHAMKAILAALGIESRIVEVLSDHVPGSLQGHVFLEVMNPRTRAWQIQDPDFDITYERVGSRLRVTVHQMIFGDLDSVEPVNQGLRGWELLNVPGLKRYFKVGIYSFEYDGGRSVAIINRERLVPARTYATLSGPLSIEDYLFKYRSQPIILYESLR